jgi:hypothetical protein
MIFRYHHMADQLLERSTLLDTITLRPGDNVEEERDTTSTSIQVNPSGIVPYPAVIGRDDTAEIIIAAALWNNANHVRKDKLKSKASDYVEVDNDIGNKAFHYTLACRWVGNKIDPYPPQGQKSDGYPTAYQCLQASIGRTRTKEDTTVRNHTQQHLTHAIHRIRTTMKVHKPYGICTAVPVYLFLSMLTSSMIYSCFGSGLTILKLPWLLHPLKSVLTSVSTVLVGFMSYLRWFVKLRACNDVKYISF